MILGIGSNKYQLIGKLILQVVFIGILALLILVTAFPRGNGTQSQWLLPIFGTLFLIFNIVIFIQLLGLPIGVSVDTSLKQITIKFLFLGSKFVELGDIDSYSTTSIFTKSSEYPGILIYLTAGKKILLSDFNLKDYTPVLRFLEESNVKSLGKEKFGFVSYYMQFFK